MTSLQLKRKADGLFDLDHQIWGQLPQLPLQSGFDQGTNSLDIDDRCGIQKPKLSDRDFVSTAAVLRGQRDVIRARGASGSWRRNHQHGADFRRQPKIGQPDVTRLGFHPGYPTLLARQFETEGDPRPGRRLTRSRRLQSARLAPQPQAAMWRASCRASRRLASCIEASMVADEAQLTMGIWQLFSGKASGMWR
jgi:hypothetical protein